MAAVFSALRSSIISRCAAVKACSNIVTRGMGSHGPPKMHITASRWQWHKFKDMLHFYVMLGVIPLGTGVLLTNMFVGPATLAPIPEDYHPKEWEYYEHPISRFIAKYLFNHYQKDYEKYLHLMFEEDEKREMRAIEDKVKSLMKERGDSQAYYYRPILTKYHKRVREEFDNHIHRRGEY